MLVSICDCIFLVFVAIQSVDVVFLLTGCFLGLSLWLYLLSWLFGWVFGVRTVLCGGGSGVGDMGDLSISSSMIR